MKQKQIKILGLELKKDLGIIRAHRLEFDENNKLIVFKGEVGAGKTTEQKALQLSTQGSKTLVDNNLYGEIDTEVQLLDGEMKVFIGCKGKDGKLTYVLYTKDMEGRKVENPVIDGVKATPSKYLDALQTELTWKMSELTSENVTVQRDILLKIYAHELKKQGVIFDKKDPNYKNSILGQIEAAENDRNYKDARRKELGGIAEDLKEKHGVDVNRPHTIPDMVNIDAIDSQIREIEKEKTIKENNSDTAKKAALSEIEARAAEEKNRILQENQKARAGYESLKKDWDALIQRNKAKNDLQHEIEQKMAELHKIGGITEAFRNRISEELAVEVTMYLEDGIEPVELELSEESERLIELREKYKQKLADHEPPDLSEYDAKIEELHNKRENAKLTNKIVQAVDSWHAWSEADGKVKQLKDKYVKMLANVDTGVEGLQIVPEDEKLYLMYNGAYDPVYFANIGMEYRKVSAYSGTQKPMICLLIQNYLLSKKPKAMRYMYIDNVPIDNKTRGLIEKMCSELDITVFLNITGDFDRAELASGEVLIENGEVFFV